MGQCGMCKAELAPGSRFCSSCGAPVGEDPGGRDRTSDSPAIAAGPSEGPPPIDGIEVELLTTSAEPVPISTARGRSVWLVAAVVLGVLGLGLWSISSGSQPASSSDEQADPDPDDRSAPATSGATTTTAATTSSERATTEVEAVIGAGEPVLGEPVGLSLLLSGGELRRLDLDTGELTTLDVDGMPIIARGGRLLLLDHGSGGDSLYSVLAADPAGPAVEIVADGAVGVAAPGPEPSQVWIATISDDVLAWRLVSLESGVTLDSLPADHSSLSLQVGPSVSGSPAGGVFTLEGGEYAKVFAGLPVAANADHVVAQTCSEPTVCQLHWLSRATWQEIDRAVPPAGTVPVWGGWLSPDSRLLGILDQRLSSLPELVMFDVERERQVDYPTTSAMMLDGPAFSSDGRFAVVARRSSLWIYDVDAGQLHELDVDPGERAVFVENG